jgi:hypothetical protein
VPFAIATANWLTARMSFESLDIMLEYHGPGEAANLLFFEVAVWTDCIRIERIQPECSAQLIDPRKL